MTVTKEPESDNSRFKSIRPKFDAIDDLLQGLRSYLWLANCALNWERTEMIECDVNDMASCKHSVRMCFSTGTRL